jgi:protein required for attachment to host cells
MARFVDALTGMRFADSCAAYCKGATMKDQTVWVMVADEAIARVLQRSDAGPLEAVHEMTDPSAHGKDADFRHDAHGRRAGGTGAHSGSAGPQGFSRGSTATTSAGQSGQHVQAEAFARHVVAWLQEAMNTRRFDALHIAAAPRFLGLLRKAMSSELSRLVVREIDKDWVQTDDADLAARLFPPAADQRAA